jgi:cell wall-associated NlpC family hydrolase
MIFNSDMLPQIVNESFKYLDVSYDPLNFNCLDFVRKVYSKFGIDPPPWKLNPSLLNLRYDEVPVGYVIYLKHREDSMNRNFTHAAIFIGNQKFIHCSYYFGNKVVISEMDELLKIYDIAIPSI